MRFPILAILLSFAASNARADEFPSLTTTLPPASKEQLEIMTWSGSDRNLPQIERQITALLQKNPLSAFGHYLMSHISIRLYAQEPSNISLLHQASTLAQQAVELDPLSDFGYVAMAEIFDIMSHPEKGATLLQQATKAGINATWRVPFMLARLSSENDFGTGSLKHFQTAIDRGPGFHEIIVPFVVAVIQSTGTDEDALKSLSEWNNKIRHSQFVFAMAAANNHLKDHNTAHKLYESLFSDSAFSKEAKLNDAIILYQNLSRPNLAIILLNSLLIDHPQLADDPDFISKVHSHLGGAYITVSNWREAHDHFIESMKNSADTNQILQFAAQSYRKQKAHLQFATLLNSAKDQVSGTGLMFGLLGETLSEDLRNHKNALVAFSDAISLEPQQSEYYTGMGLTYYRLKQLDDALRYFRLAKAVDSTDAIARYNEACVLAIQGQIDRAFESLQDAVALDPRLRETARNDKDFSSINRQDRFINLINDATPEHSQPELSH